MSKKTKAKAKRRKAAQQRKARRRKLAGEQEVAASELPDRRAMEGVMQQLLASTFGEDNDSPAGQAQQIMYAAFEEQDPQRQIQMAQQALAVSPDCADAYVLLCEYAGSDKERLDLAQEAVAAGERAIGRGKFKEYAGHFWGVLETRPYMRARHELANCLWKAGKQDEAIEHYQEMLRLNPNDNQGVRYVLLTCLLELGRDADATSLLEVYDDDYSAAWFYSRSLLAFRRDGDTQPSRELLREAAEMNPHIPSRIAGYENIPSDLPPYVGRGDESEADYYAASDLRNWKGTPGAVPWLRDVLKVARPERRAPRRTPWHHLQADLTELPQDENEIWHADVRELQLEAAGEDNPWGLIVTSPTRQQMIAADMTPDKPTAAEAIERLAKIMLDPEDGEPRRPGVLHVRLKTYLNSWGEKLSGAGIQCRQVSPLEDIDMVLEAMSETTKHGSAAKQAPPLSDDELCQLPQVAEETWQADARLMAMWIGDEGQPQRPWMAMVTNAAEGTIIAQEMTTDPPQEEWLAAVVRQAMSNPTMGEPHRPGTLAVRSESAYRQMNPLLDQLNIHCELADELDHIDFVFDDMTRHMALPGQPAALLDSPGIEPHHAARFCEAAAEFYEAHPWRTAPVDVAIRVECDELTSTPWYAVVMGQNGMVQGVALYEDFDLLQRLLTGRLSDEENARRTSALTVQFNEAFEIPSIDLHHIEKYGWPVAGPEAYPEIMRVNPGMSTRPPLTWELQLATATLRAVPKFLARSAPFRENIPVQLDIDTHQLRLSWATDL